MTSTVLQPINASANPQVQMNDNAESLSAAAIFSKRQPATSGLTWGYYGGLYNGNAIADGTVTLSNGATNYVVVLRSTGVVSTSTSTTNSLDTNYAKLYKVTTAGGVVTDTDDLRMDDNGLLIGGTGGGGGGGGGGIDQVIKSAAYTLVLGDANKHILHPAGDPTARTFTIPDDASVSFPIGTTITFVNQHGAGTVTIAITTDVMRLAGAGTGGSRTLVADGIATALKIATTEWIVNGVGLT